MTETAGAAAAVLEGGIGAENMEPTLVVPKNCGTEGASDRGGALRRAASEAGRNPALAALDAEAEVMATVDGWETAALVRVGGGGRVGGEDRMF